MLYKKKILLLGFVVCNTFLIQYYTGSLFIRNIYEYYCNHKHFCESLLSNRTNEMYIKMDSSLLPMHTFLRPIKKDTLMPDMNSISDEEMAPIIATLKKTLVQAAANVNVKDINLNLVTFTKGNIKQSILDALYGESAELRGITSVSGCDDDFVTTITVYVRDYGKSTFDKRIHYKTRTVMGISHMSYERQGVYKVPTAYTIVVSTSYRELSCIGSYSYGKSSIAIRGNGVLLSPFEIKQTGVFSKASKSKKK